MNSLLKLICNYTLLSFLIIGATNTLLAQTVGYDEDDEYDELYQDVMENYRKNLKKSQPKISLDSLLDKIKEKGLDSLSDVEKQILESYSK